LSVLHTSLLVTVAMVACCVSAAHAATPTPGAASANSKAASQKQTSAKASNSKTVGSTAIVSQKPWTQSPSGEKATNPALLRPASARTNAAPKASAKVSSKPGSKTVGRKKADVPDLRSNAALVIDTGEGTILYARNAEQAMPIASLTKLMTSLVVLEKGLPLAEEIEIVRDDRDGTRGVASRVAVGAKLTRGDLMHLALMASDNRAAHALGRTYLGGKSAMIEAMNRKAQTLGMTHTRFVDTSGLSSGNVASASDVAKLVQAVAKFAPIREYSTDQDHSVVVLKHATRFRNTNYLVTKEDWLIDVQKTGFTNDAGQCLAMKAAIQGRSVVIVLLDSFGKHTRTADARRIRKWLEAHPAQRVAQVGP